MLDTNVLVSAYLFGGKPGALLQLIIEGEVTAASSPPLLDELQRVLESKLRLPRSHVELFLGEWKALALLSEPTVECSIIQKDPSDNRVLECAVSAKADAIVSGDRHLLALGSFRGIPILTPDAFLARWSRERR